MTTIQRLTFYWCFYSFLSWVFAAYEACRAIPQSISLTAKIALGAEAVAIYPLGWWAAYWVASANVAGTPWTGLRLALLQAFSLALYAPLGILGYATLWEHDLHTWEFLLAIISTLCWGSFLTIPFWFLVLSFISERSGTVMTGDYYCPV